MTWVCLKIGYPKIKWFVIDFPIQMLCGEFFGYTYAHLIFTICSQPNHVVWYPMMSLVLVRINPTYNHQKHPLNHTKPNFTQQIDLHLGPRLFRAKKNKVPLACHGAPCWSRVSSFPWRWREIRRHGGYHSLRLTGWLVGWLVWNMEVNGG